MSSLFLNGLYTNGINALTSANDLLLGGRNTNNIQILSPIIGDRNNTITFSSVNTTDIVNTITQNYCFNSIVSSALLSVTNNSNTNDTTLLLDASTITLDANNITLNANNLTLSLKNSINFNSNDINTIINNFTTKLNEYITMGTPNTLLPSINQIGYKYLLIYVEGPVVMNTTISRYSNDFTIPKGTWIIELSASIQNNTAFALVGITNNISVINLDCTSSVYLNSSGTTVTNAIITATGIIQNIADTIWAVNGYRGTQTTVSVSEIKVYATRIS
jgi:hypothetical protein